MNYLAIVVAAVAVFVLSSVYYSAFATQLATLNPAYSGSSTRMAPWKIGVELIRNLVLASVIACLVDLTGMNSWSNGATLGALLWVGFPVVLWTGAVIWEKVPPKLATIHAGDWLLKLLIVSIIISVWR